MKTTANKTKRRAANAAAIAGRKSTRNLPYGKVPSRWRWHWRALLALQERLLRERSDSRRVAAEPLEPHSLDEADSATDEFDHDLALSRLSAEQDALNEVSQAIQRILAGTYGRCEESGARIPAARLKAIPWTRFTREVEARLEKKGIVRRARVREASTVRGSGRIWLAPEEEAEEVEHAPPAAAKDEALSHMSSPPEPRVTQHRKPRPRPDGAARRKGRSA